MSAGALGNRNLQNGAIVSDGESDFRAEKCDSVERRIGSFRKRCPAKSCIGGLQNCAPVSYDPSCFDVAEINSGQVHRPGEGPVFPLRAPVKGLQQDSPISHDPAVLRVDELDVVLLAELDCFLG